MKKLVLSAMLTGLVGSTYAGIVYTDTDPDGIVGLSTALPDGFGNSASVYQVDFNQDQNVDASINWSDLDYGSNVNNYPNNAD